MNDKISIIVPVYNVEKYLDECIQSIINQTHKNIEIILINDGSTDNSLSILRKYESIDKRIIVVDKKNGGVSAARNYGLDICTSKYIMFVDADDYLELNALEIIFKEIREDTFIIFGYNMIYKNKVIKKGDNININSLEEMGKNIFFNNNIGGFIANKIFNKRIIEKNNLSFNEKLSYCEDLVFVCEYIKYIKKFKYINIPLYNYRMRKSSTSYSFLTGNNIEILKSYEVLLSKFNKREIINNIKYRYIESYYIFKKYLDINLVNTGLLKDEKNIINNNCKTMFSKFKFFIIKHFLKVGLLYKKIDLIINKPFD